MKTMLLILAAVMMCLSGCCKKETQTKQEAQSARRASDAEYMLDRIGCGLKNGICLCVFTQGGMVIAPTEVCESND